MKRLLIKIFAYDIKKEKAIAQAASHLKKGLKSQNTKNAQLDIALHGPMPHGMEAVVRK